MPSIPQALSELQARRAELASNLQAMGINASVDEPLDALVAKVLGIDTGTPPPPAQVGWRPQSDWPDIRDILESDTTAGYGGKYIQLMTDHPDSTALAGALAYRTSDGAFYTSNVTHTWDRAKDFPCSLGYKTRWAIYYKADTGTVDIQPTALWAILAMHLNTITSVNSKQLLQAFEFISPFNLSSTQPVWSNLFMNDYSLVKLPDSLDFSNATSLNNTFRSCNSLVEVPRIMDVSSCASMTYFMNGCPVVEPPELNMINVADAGNAFTQCPFVRNMRIKNLKASLNISASAYHTRDDMLHIINSLQPVGGQTLTVGAVNLAKLTPQDIAIATGKGWAIA